MKFFKSVIAVTLSIGMVFSMVGCSSGNDNESPTNPTLTNGDETNNNSANGDETKPGAGKSYVIATDTTFAPFEFVDKDGKFVGIDIDLINAIAEDQGFEIELQSLGFNAALQAVQSGQADGMIAGMSITEERKLQFDFSKPYYDSNVVMGISSSNEDIKSYRDLNGKKVAVKTGTEGYTFAESISEQYGFEMTVFDDSSSMYQDVISGNSVACFEDFPVLQYGINTGLALKIVTEKEKGSSYGFGVVKGKNAELVQMFNDGYDNIVENGKYQEILDTYIQE